MYALKSENLTNLGRPMGTEYTYPNWTKYFHSLAAAKAFAQADYESHHPDVKKEKLEWHKRRKGQRYGSWLATRDLGYVMYHINPLKFEDEPK